MSLQIAVAHTGQRLDADPVAFTSVDALKYWISRTTEIPPEQQVLLTTQGKHVKLQALLTEASHPFFEGHTTLCPLHTNTSVCRRRYLYLVARSPTTRRLPYPQHLYPIPSLPTMRRIISPTTRTLEHGKHSSKPAATGRLRFSRSHIPCHA